MIFFNYNSWGSLMKLSKLILNLLTTPLIIISLNSNPITKIDPQNLEPLNVRYLDHLEYAVAESDLGNADEKNPNPRFNPKNYVDQINKKYSAPVYIAFINDQVGHGVFAQQNIKKGHMIGEYTGIVKHVNFSNKKEDYDYAWGFPPPAKFVIDSTHAGNFTRFINHCNNHNVDMVYVPINNRWHLIYVANQDIKKDDQLLANYGKPYWRGRNTKPCDFKQINK